MTPTESLVRITSHLTAEWVTFKLGIYAQTAAIFYWWQPTTQTRAHNHNWPNNMWMLSGQCLARPLLAPHSYAMWRVSGGRYKASPTAPLSGCTGTFLWFTYWDNLVLSKGQEQGTVQRIHTADTGISTTEVLCTMQISSILQTETRGSLSCQVSWLIYISG